MVRKRKERGDEASAKIGRGSTRFAHGLKDGDALQVDKKKVTQQLIQQKGKEFPHGENLGEDLGRGKKRCGGVSVR